MDLAHVACNLADRRPEVLYHRNATSLPISIPIVLGQETHSLVFMQDLRKRFPSPLLLLAFTQPLLTQLLFREGCRIRIESQKHLLVLERVLLLHTSSLRGRIALRLIEHALHLATIDETRNVGVADDVAGEEEVGLQLASLSGGAVDVVKRGKGVRRPDDEAAQVTARR